MGNNNDFFIDKKRLTVSGESIAIVESITDYLAKLGVPKHYCNTTNLFRTGLFLLAENSGSFGELIDKISKLGQQYGYISTKKKENKNSGANRSFYLTEKEFELIQPVLIKLNSRWGELLGSNLSRVTMHGYSNTELTLLVLVSLTYLNKMFAGNHHQKPKRILNLFKTITLRKSKFSENGRRFESLIPSLIVLEKMAQKLAKKAKKQADEHDDE